MYSDITHSQKHITARSIPKHIEKLQKKLAEQVYKDGMQLFKLDKLSLNLIPFFCTINSSSQIINSLIQHIATHFIIIYIAKDLIQHLLLLIKHLISFSCFLWFYEVYHWNPINFIEIIMISLRLHKGI